MKGMLALSRKVWSISISAEDLGEYYNLNDCVLAQIHNSCVEILIPSVMVLGGMASGT